MMGWIRKATCKVIGPSLVPLTCALLFTVGCDRNIAPYDPDEKPSQPDLGKIFPKGSEGPQGPAVPPDAGRRGADVPPAAPAAAVPAGDPIRGTIRLGDGMTAPPGAVLFIIARRGEGGPPLAVKRIMGARFPLDFTLGPDDRMIQQMPFMGPLTVTARIDGDGNAMSRNPGDLQGAVPEPVATGTTGIDLVIDEML